MWKLPNSPSPVKQILTISNGNGLICRKAKFSFLRRCHDVPRGQASRMKCGSSTGGGCLASNRRTTAAGSGGRATRDDYHRPPSAECVDGRDIGRGRNLKIG
jgi:hypothetical protein